MNLSTDQALLLLVADLQRDKEALRARVAELEAALQERDE